MIEWMMRSLKHFVRIMIFSFMIWNIAWGIVIPLAPYIDRFVRGNSAAAFYAANDHTWAFYLSWYVVTFAASFYIGRIAKNGGWFYAGLWALFTPFMTMGLIGIDRNWALVVNILFIAVSTLGGFAGQRILTEKPARRGGGVPTTKRAAAR